MGNKRKKLVVLSGSGISQESGLKTFRDMGGLWEEYDITEVASPEAWHTQPEVVLRFYNERRKQLFNAKPNDAHRFVAQLEKWFEVEVVTQNVDDLHEQAGSRRVLHLHGELRKARSTANPALVYTLDNWELQLGDLCELGSQLRPHIVWFGEPVPLLGEAISLVSDAEILIVIGTSLTVYPAASLIGYTPDHCRVFVVDPGEPVVSGRKATFIRKKASEGCRELLPVLEKLK